MAARRSNACFTGEEVVGLLDLDGVEEDIFPGSDDELGFSEEEERYTHIPGKMRSSHLVAFTFVVYSGSGTVTCTLQITLPLPLLAHQNMTVWARFVPYLR